jgi:hypothetical protein
MTMTTPTPEDRAAMEATYLAEYGVTWTEDYNSDHEYHKSSRAVGYDDGFQAALTYARGNAWRSMDSAPGGGEWILLWGPSTIPTQAAFANFPGITPGWYSDGKKLNAALYTHWHKLPTPPTTPENQG